MELNPERIEAIKGHFAQKPSAELRAILEVHDTATLSDEAFAAAEAVLAERARGEAVEPGAVNTEPLSPPARLWPDHALARGLIWALRGLTILAAIWGVIRLEVALQAVGAVVLLLAIAEGLRLCILIEENTRGIVPRRGSEQLLGTEGERSRPNRSHGQPT